MPRNSQRKGGKLDDKFSGPYVIDKITDLGIMRLRMLKGKVFKKGIPTKQLQKYNKKDDKGNYSNTSSETENEDQPRKRRRLSSDAESSTSNVDVMLGTVHHVDSNTMSEKHKKQEATLSVIQSVTPAKQDHATLSVKQSVTRNTVNDKESFTHMPTNTTYNKKKIRLTPMISPITQLKGGIKKPQPHKRKFFFQLSTDEKEKTGTEIELCDTLPDLDDENKDKVCVELCDTLNTLPDIPVPVQNNQQTDGHERQKTNSEPEIQETGFFKGDPVLFFPTTNSTRRNIAPLFGLFDVNSVMRQMPNYKFGRIGQGVKPPKKCFVIKGDGNCYFRAVSFILTGVEKHHFVVRQAICDFIAVYYHDLNLFLDKYKDGKEYLIDTEMRKNVTWGTELEIIVTATMAKRDAIVYNHTGYLRYQSPFAQGKSIECFFIDNRAGGILM